MSRVTISNKWQNCKYEYYAKFHAHIHVSTFLLCHYWSLMSAAVMKIMLPGVTPCDFVMDTIVVRGPGSSIGILITGWTVRGSNPGGGEIFRTCPDRPWGPPSLLYNGYRVFPGGKVRPGRDADHSPPSSADVFEE